MPQITAALQELGVKYSYRNQCSDRYELQSPILVDAAYVDDFPTRDIPLHTLTKPLVESLPAGRIPAP